MLSVLFHPQYGATKIKHNDSHRLLDINETNKWCSRIIVKQK